MILAVNFGLVLCAALGLSAPQDYRTTPVPILKQINRHNDDGSYSYGYESADGTFKIETKYPTGEVFGKYGYIGDDGKIREIEYGASKRGFEPVGSDINVAPPTLSNSIEDSPNADFDDGQYREDPSIYYKKTSGSSGSGFSGANAFSGRSYPLATSAPVYQNPQPRYYQPQYYQPRPQYTPQTQHYNIQPRYYNSQPRYFNSQTQYQPAPFTYDPSLFNGHPATNFDINTGSYTISYSG